jgi:hypothetical protein
MANKRNGKTQSRFQGRWSALACPSMSLGATQHVKTLGTLPSELLTLPVSGVDLRLEDTEPGHHDGRQGTGPQQGGRLPTHRLHLWHHPRTPAAASEHKVRLGTVSSVAHLK